MIKIGHMTCPANVTDQVGMVYSGLPKLPEYITNKHVYVKPEITDELHVMAIYEFDDEQADEVIPFLEERLSQFDKIDGLKHWMEDWVDTQSLLHLLSEGMKASDVLSDISIRI